MLYKKTLALYIRLSIEDGDLKKSVDKTESNSVSNQRKLLLDYYRSHPELNEYELVEFCDDGYSGTNFERPQFQEMMQQVKRGQIHCIMVKDLSRFGREYLEVGAYLELILPLFGTRFISVNDAFDTNRYVGTTGGMELALRNLINGMYSRDLSVKVRSAIKTRNRRGQYWGGNTFYGYALAPDDKHRLVVDEEVRKVIVMIFELCVEGLSTMQIAQRLNELDILCPAEYKKKKGGKYNGRTVEKRSIWLGGTVRKILNDERYTGKMVSGTRESDGIRTNKMKMLPKEEWIVVEGTHEAIISQELFDQAAASLRSRIRTVNDNTSGDRSGNLFVCGYCGRKLQKSNGKQIHLYCIKGRSDTSSDCDHIHEEWNSLKNTVLQVFLTHVKLMYEKAEKVKVKSVSEEAALRDSTQKIESKIRALRNRKTTLYEEYRSGKYTKEQFVKMKAQDEREIAEMAKKLEENSQNLDQVIKRKKAADNTMSATSGIVLTSYDPKIVRRFVDEIKVYGKDRMEICFKNSDLYASESDNLTLVKLEA